MKYYILYKDENHGPLEPSEMEEFDLNPKSRVWAPGWASWKDAEEVEEIMDFLTRRETQAREAREQAEQKANAAREQAQAQAAREQAQAQAAREQAQAQAAREQAQAQAAREQAQAQAAREQTQAQAQTQADEESEQATGTEWYYAINNQQYGPVSEEALRDLGISPNTLVWNESLGSSWIAASQVPALAYLFVQDAPSIQPATATTPAVAASTNRYTQPVTSTNAGGSTEMISGIYNLGIAGAVCAVITIIMCFVKGEYYDSKELMTILAVCALPSVILSVCSLSAAKNCSNSCKLGNERNALKQHGISIGCGIGAILSAVVGLILAVKDFDIV